jgi:hypothetical protein
MLSPLNQELYVLGMIIGTITFVFIPAKECIYRIITILLLALIQVVTALFFGPFEVYLSFAIIYLVFLLPFTLFGYNTLKDYIQGLIQLKEKIIDTIKNGLTN